MLDETRLLSDKQFLTLQSACAALAPGGADVAPLFLSLLAGTGNETSQQQFRRALSLLESRFANWLLSGQFRAFSRMALPDRERALRSWATSRLPQLRAGFQGLKRLTLFLRYAHRDARTGLNPDWAKSAIPALRHWQAQPLGP